MRSPIYGVVKSLAKAMSKLDADKLSDKELTNLENCLKRMSEVRIKDGSRLEYTYQGKECIAVEMTFGLADILLPDGRFIRIDDSELVRVK